MENGEVICSGYLFKSPPENKLRNLRSWTRRFFVLYRNKLLYYYKNDKERKPVKDPIQLTYCRCVESNLKHEKFDFLFSVATDKRTYFLGADTQQTMETWVDKLCFVCGFIRTEQEQTSELNKPEKPNEYSISQARPRPIANKPGTMSPVGTPSSFSSSGSSMTSPTGPCPLSIPEPLLESPVGVQRQSGQAGSSSLPGYVQGVRNKARLSGNLSEACNAEPLRPLSGDDYDNLPSPKSVLAQSLSSPALDTRHQGNYDNVPSTRALNSVALPLSPRSDHLSPDEYDQLPTPRPVSQASNRSSQDVYDLVPPPRPVSSCSQDDQGVYDIPPSGKIDNEENYDFVPPPRPTSSYSQEDQGLYSIPPKVGMGDQENYCVVPPPRPTSSCSEDDQMRTSNVNSREQQNYDFVPPVSRPVTSKPSYLQSDRSQQNYDVLPVRDSIYDVPPVGKSPEQEQYDIVPPCRPVAPKPNHIKPRTSQENNYDSLATRQTPQHVYNNESTKEGLPSGRLSVQENYDTVPLVHRPVVPKLNHFFQQGLSQENYHIVQMPQTSHKISNSSGVYDNLATERASPSENYDIVPFVNRPVSTISGPRRASTPQDIYDIVPAPRPSDGNYDVLPPPRDLPRANQPGDSPNGQSDSSREHDQRFADIYSVPPNQQSSDSREWVPPPKPSPYQSSQDGYDPLPNTNRPVSADSGLNASFSSVCSLKSDGDHTHEDRYDVPLPPLPAQSRDSGSLSDDMPDYDVDPSDIYDVPPNWESNNYVHNGVLSSHPNEVPDTPQLASDEIYDVPPNRDQGLVSSSESKRVPMVDRSTKPPPMVNRAVKPKSVKEEHSYCNMPPKVDRESKYKRSTVPPSEHHYMNYGVPPMQRPQHLPLVKTLPGKPFAGAGPNQTDRWSAGYTDDADYCPMQPPTRSEMTRCFSFNKEVKPGSRAADQCYEDMSALQARRHSSGKCSSSSSSASSLADNEELYMPMAPPQMEQRHRRDLLYAEVEIVDGANHVAPVPNPLRRENTQYTYINEESTRALLQTSHAWQGNR